MGKKAVIIFDLDGVLLDSESDVSWIKNSIHRTLNHFDLPLSEKVFQFLHFKNVRQFKEMSHQLQLDPSVLWPVRNRFYTEEKINAMKNRIIKPFSDVDSLYELINFFNLGIISNSPQSIVDFFISEFNYQDLFKYPIGRGDTLWDIEYMKPHAFLFSKMQILTSADSWIFVGDRDTDKRFAENTGMTYLHLQRDTTANNSFSTLNEIVSYVLNHKNKWL